MTFQLISAVSGNSQLDNPASWSSRMDPTEGMGASNRFRDLPMWITLQDGFFVRKIWVTYVD